MVPPDGSIIHLPAHRFTVYTVEQDFTFEIKFHANGSIQIMHNKRWVIQPPITPQADEALAKFPPILKQVLFNRGMGTDAEARAFLKAEPNSNTDPFQLIGMRTAVDRIQYALEQNEPIAVYGDYDVDGVTATALLVEALQGFGADVRGYIPNRFDEGYGLNPEALDHLKADGVKLVITGLRHPLAR